MGTRVAFQWLSHYGSFADEAPFPEIESPGLAQNRGDVLTAYVFAVKEYETEPSPFAR